MDDSLRNATEELVHHDGLVLFRDTVKGLLHNVAAEGVHAEVERVAANGLSNGHDLLRATVLEAALHKEIAKTVDHERVGLIDDSLDDLVLLLRCADLELLLQEDRGLLVVAAHDLVDNVAPVATHVAVEQSTVV